MNVTFLIGNGFDLGVGLKTKYSDFYKSYINDKTKGDLLVSNIQKDYETWSDLETALGKCLKDIDYKDRDVFLESKYNLEIALAEYLEKQESLIDYNLHKENIMESMSKTLNNFLDNLPRTEKEKVMNTIRRLNDTLHFHFITFNYTKVLDKCIDFIKSNNKLLEPYYGDKNTLIGSVYHIHGLTDSEMILGINDESQINNPELSKDPEFNDMMIKSNLNSGIAQDKVRIVEDIINSSDVIVIYGMSMGITDNHWWKFLANWLQAANYRIIIVCTYEEEDNQRKNPYRTINAKKKIVKMFSERAQISEHIQDQLKQQIIVVRNPTNMFAMDLTLLDEGIENEVATALD